MATSRTVKRYRDASRSTEWLSTRSNSIKTPLTSCGVYDALDQRWEQARAVADPPSASVPPTRSRVSQERFAFHILLTFQRLVDLCAPMAPCIAVVAACFTAPITFFGLDARRPAGTL